VELSKARERRLIPILPNNGLLTARLKLPQHFEKIPVSILIHEIHESCKLKIHKMKGKVKDLFDAGTGRKKGLIFMDFLLI
jgi:hypothetical protein